MKLTKYESMIALYILQDVIDKMFWSNDFDEYQDSGDILIHLSKEDYLAAKRVIAKIMNDDEPDFLCEALNSGDGVYRP